MLVYPAAFANVMGVGALTVDSQRSPISNFGEDLVSVAAQGEDVVTTYPGGRYAVVFGTSFSTPVVASSVAVLRELDDELDQHGAEAALAMGRERDGAMGYGKLNLLGSLRWLAQSRRR